MKLRPHLQKPTPWVPAEIYMVATGGQQLWFSFPVWRYQYLEEQDNFFFELLCFKFFIYNIKLFTKVNNYFKISVFYNNSVNILCNAHVIEKKVAVYNHISCYSKLTLI